MEHMTYNYFNEVHEKKNSKYEAILKMPLLYLGRYGRMLSRFDVVF